jgi:integrase
MDFTSALKSKRENLSANSLKTYNSLLRTIYKNSFPEDKDKEVDIDKFTKEKGYVLEFLKSKPFSTRKTLLASLVCIAPDVDEYKKMMMGDIKTYTEEIDKQESTDKQKENSVSNQEIREALLRLKQQSDMIYKKKFISNDDIQKLQDYIILSLLSGFYIVPRRAMDYTELKIRGIGEDDNHIDKNKLVFQKYKTAKFYGKQVLDIPVQLKNILNKYISILPSKQEYLLVGGTGQKLSSASLNQRLNKIFDGHISINALRHSYLTEKYKDVMIKNKQLEKEMTAMGSSENQAKTYIKLD